MLVVLMGCDLELCMVNIFIIYYRNEIYFINCFDVGWWDRGLFILEFRLFN